MRRVDRRTTIKWLAATMAAAHAGCSPGEKRVGDEIPAANGNLLGDAARSGGAGYGADPSLLEPFAPWPKTMTEAQRMTAAALADAILPEDDRSPAASAVGVHDFIDEWISAPYRQQREDRPLILEGLEWLERQSRARLGVPFARAADEDRAALVDPLAYPDRADPAPAERVRFFERFRYLAVGAFYTTEAGIRDIGYLGNVPIAGPYPGPSDEALAHLAGVLRQLGLPAPGQ